MRLDWDALVDSTSFRNICRGRRNCANDKATTCASRARRRMARNGWQAARQYRAPPTRSETSLPAWTKNGPPPRPARLSSRLRYVFINETHPEYRRRTEHAEFIMPVSDVFRARRSRAELSRDELFARFICTFDLQVSSRTDTFRHR